MTCSFRVHNFRDESCSCQCIEKVRKALRTSPIMRFFIPFTITTVFIFMLQHAAYSLISCKSFSTFLFAEVAFLVFSETVQNFVCRVCLH